MDKTEREAWEKELDDYENQRRRSYSYKAPRINPIGYIVVAGIFAISILAMFLHKSDNDRCKC